MDRYASCVIPSSIWTLNSPSCSPRRLPSTNSGEVMFRSMARMYLWLLLKVRSCGLRPPTTEDSPSPISSTIPRSMSPARLEETEDLLIPSCFAKMVLEVISLLKMLSSTARLFMFRTRDISTDSDFSSMHLFHTPSVRLRLAACFVRNEYQLVFTIPLSRPVVKTSRRNSRIIPYESQIKAERKRRNDLVDFNLKSTRRNSRGAADEAEYDAPCRARYQPCRERRAPDGRRRLGAGGGTPVKEMPPSNCGQRPKPRADGSGRAGAPLRRAEAGRGHCAGCFPPRVSDPALDIRRPSGLYLG